MGGRVALLPWANSNLGNYILSRLSSINFICWKCFLEFKIPSSPASGWEGWWFFKIIMVMFWSRLLGNTAQEFWALQSNTSGGHKFGDGCSKKLFQTERILWLYLKSFLFSSLPFHFDRHVCKLFGRRETGRRASLVHLTCSSIRLPWLLSVFGL